jgi:hypothetical protein
VRTLPLEFAKESRALSQHGIYPVAHGARQNPVPNDRP